MNEEPMVKLEPCSSCNAELGTNVACPQCQAHAERMMPRKGSQQLVQLTCEMVQVALNEFLQAGAPEGQPIPRPHVQIVASSLAQGVGALDAALACTGMPTKERRKLLTAAWRRGYLSLSTPAGTVPAIRRKG